LLISPLELREDKCGFEEVLNPAEKEEFRIPLPVINEQIDIHHEESNGSVLGGKFAWWRSPTILPNYFLFNLMPKLDNA
jgi:hypothetical protein